MDATQRREAVRNLLKQQSRPVSASKLADMLHVSRQIIVGDVALLRTAGCDIIATSRGYLLADTAVSGRFTGKIACKHSREDTILELYTIVDLGGEVVDVIVDHFLYGEMIGQLNLQTRQDVDQFFSKVREGGARLLSELTEGVHLHTVACRDSTAFEQIKGALSKQSLLFHGD